MPVRPVQIFLFFGRRVDCLRVRVRWLRDVGVKAHVFLSV